MGEVTAAVVAGALTAAEGLQVIATRSRLMSRLAGQGAMALLELDSDATAALIADHPEVTLAVYASPGQTVIAGPPEAIDRLIAAVAKQSRLARRIDVDVASHHPTIDPILPELRSALAGLAPKPPTIPIITTTHDHTATPAPDFDADHWVANVRQPVWFHQAVAAAAQQHTTFIEVSPHPLLAHAIRDIVADPHHHIVATLQRDTDDTLTFHTNHNSTCTSQPPLTPHPPEPHRPLPNTPWQHTSHWISAGPPTRRPESAVIGEWNFEMAWPVRPLTAVEAWGDGSWLVVAEASEMPEIRRVLGDDSRVAVAEPSALSDDAESAALLDALGGASNVLYAPAVSATDFDAESGYRLFSAARRLSAALATVASPPRLFLLTRNTRIISEPHGADPADAILWVLGRTLAQQYPQMWGGVVELNDSAPAGPTADEDSATAPTGDIKDLWRTCDPESRRTLLRNHVGVLVAAVMGLPSSQSLNPTADFFELGMDSLMNVILQRALAETLGEVLPQTVVFDYPTVEALADHLAAIAESDLSESVG
jgi:acyl transferase domain-containing protein